MTLDIKQDLKFSTRTIIAEINYNVDIKKLFNLLPVAYPLKGFGKTNICYMYDKHTSKGDVAKKKKKTKKKATEMVVQDTPNMLKSFRNSLNILIESDTGNILTIKVGRLGRLHVTGAKEENDCVQAVKYLVELILSLTEKDILMLSPDLSQIDESRTRVTVRFLTIMTNYIWNTHFKIDKEKLNTLLNNQSDFINLYETSFGYTGVNVKREINIDNFVNKIDIPIHVYDKDTKEWNLHFEKRQTFGKQNKPKHNTFLVFNSGKCIVSGIQEEIMQDDFELFSKFLTSNRPFIEEFLAC